MIGRLIHWSIANRFLVILATVFLTAWGIWSIKQTPVDALPDLSDVQVIIRTSYPGQAPQIVENQVSYPLSTTMLSVPGATTVRPEMLSIASVIAPRPTRYLTASSAPDSTASPNGVAPLAATALGLAPPSIRIRTIAVSTPCWR